MILEFLQEELNNRGWFTYKAMIPRGSCLNPNTIICDNSTGGGPALEIILSGDMIVMNNMNMAKKPGDGHIRAASRIYKFQDPQFNLITIVDDVGKIIELYNEMRIKCRNGEQAANPTWLLWLWRSCLW